MAGSGLWWRNVLCGFGMDVVAYDTVPNKVRSPATAFPFEELVTDSGRRLGQSRKSQSIFE